MAEPAKGPATVLAKLRLKPGMAAYVAGVPTALKRALALPEDVRDMAGDTAESGVPLDSPALGESEFVLTFVNNQAGAVAAIAELEPALVVGAVTWIAYPKGSKAAGHDVSRDTIWRAANEAGSVLNANVSLDETWSAVRIRKAKPGEL